MLWHQHQAAMGATAEQYLLRCHPAAAPTTPPPSAPPCPPKNCDCGCGGDVTVHIHHHYDSGSFQQSAEAEARQEAADIFADLPQLKVRHLDN